MRGNWLLVLCVFCYSNLRPLFTFALHLDLFFPFQLLAVFPTPAVSPSYLLRLSCFLLSPSPPGYRVKTKVGMVRIGEKRNTVAFFFFSFISGFELSLHLNYADDKKEAAVSIHIVLQLQDSFLVFFT